MRKLTYLSPTSIRLFYEDRERFYVEYLCESRKKRDLQTPPMAVGSAFDAYAKSYLHEKLVGNKDPRFSFDKLFNDQVEVHNRDECKAAGKTVFDLYMKHGGLADLMKDLEGCLGTPKFETSVEGFVDCVSVKVGAVPLLGKPDIYFLTKEGARIIFDWKTTGYYATRNYSPKQGYIKELPGSNIHKRAMGNVYAVQGFKINCGMTLDEVDPSWAAQLSIYAWLLGQDVGSKFIVAIDEIVCTKDTDIGTRNVRIAQHRCHVSPDFQYDLFRKAHAAWYAIQGNHIFDEMPLEESIKRCQALDARMVMENGPQTEEDEFFKSMLD